MQPRGATSPARRPSPASRSLRPPSGVRRCSVLREAGRWRVAWTHHSPCLRSTVHARVCRLHLSAVVTGAAPNGCRQGLACVRFSALEDAHLGGDRTAASEEQADPGSLCPGRQRARESTCLGEAAAFPGAWPSAPRGGSLRAEDGREAEAAILQHIRTFVRLFNQTPTYVSCEGTLQV